MSEEITGLIEFRRIWDRTKKNIIIMSYFNENPITYQIKNEITTKEELFVKVQELWHDYNKKAEYYPTTVTVSYHLYQLLTPLEEYPQLMPFTPFNKDTYGKK